jgi:outer membrane protein insertion porin family
MIKKISKIALAIYFFLALFINYAHAEIIKKIIIDGNERVNKQTIIMFGEFSIGDDVTDNDLNIIIKNLYQTNFFKDLSVTLSESLLKISVVENPIIQNLIINGVKSNSLEDILYKQIKLKNKNPFIENEVKNDLNRIQNILQQTGFYFSKVDTSIKTNNNNTVDLIFNIDLGRKSYINEIVFLGDKKFKTRKLLNIIASEESKFWKIISNKKFLNKERIKLDKRLLESFYKNKGYFNVSIKSQTIQYDEDENFKLAFNIESGDKYFFNNFIINFPDDYDSKYFKKITNKLTEFSGSFYSYRVLEKILTQIENVATGQRYEFVDATIDQKITDNNKIDITINITESQKFYVKKINILGNSVTIEDVVRNELIVDEGDPLNNILLKKSINNIKSLNIFKNVSSKIVDSKDPAQKIINISVDEKATGEISLGAGIGSSGASTAFGVRENNFLGKGIRLNSEISLNADTFKGQFSVVNKNFKNTDRDLIASVQALETDRIKDFGYKTNKTGFEFGSSFEHLEDLYITPMFSTYYESVETSASASSSLKKQEGSYLDIKGSYKIDIDKRNQAYKPSDGFRSQFTQVIPLNIDSNQTIVNGYELNSYYEYLPDVVGAISLYGRAANSFGDDDVRISDRLYLPSKKLRGFEPGKIGPVDNGDFIGGNFNTALNISSELPILESMETTSFNVFFDVANVWGVDYSSAINDSSAIRSATGIGIDWYTPVGPLSFTLSQPIAQKSTDKTESFRFNLGTTF